MDRIYTMKNAEETIGYGKHSYCSIIDLALYYPEYIEWMEKREDIFFSDT